MENPVSGTKILFSVLIIAIIAGAGFFFFFKNSPQTNVAEYQIESSTPSQSGATGTESLTGITVVTDENAVAFASKAEGKVLRKTDAGETTVVSGDAIASGDAIVTGGDSRVEIVFADSSIVRLAANSILTIKMVDATTTDLELSTGELWARILKPLSDESFFSIKTSDLSAGVRGTSLRMKKAGKKTDVQVIDSVAKSAETPGVDIIYKDQSGVEIRDRVLPEESFSIDSKEHKKDKKKLTISEAMKDTFVRENTMEDLAHMDLVRKALKEGKKPVEAILPQASEKFLAKFPVAKIRSFEERIDKELSVTIPKKEEIPFFFAETTIRERAVKISELWSTSGSGEKVASEIFMESILLEASREAQIIQKTREIERVRHEIEGQAPDAAKRQEIERRVDLLKKGITADLEKWKKEPLPTSTGSVVASGTTLPTTLPPPPVPAVKPAPLPVKPAVSGTPVVKPAPLPIAPAPLPVKPAVSGTPIPR